MSGPALARAEQTALNIRFIDSATGCAIEPEHIAVRRHSDSGEQAIDTPQFSRGGRTALALERGSYTITVTSPRHEPMSGDFVVRDHNLYQHYFMLEPIVQPRELQPDEIAALQRRGETLLQGFVVCDDTGRPLNNVRVSSLPSGLETRTDARGFFRFHVPAQFESEDVREEDRILPIEPEDPGNLMFQTPGYRAKEFQHLELWSGGDWTYRVRMEPGSGRQIEDERLWRRREGGVGEPLELEVALGLAPAPQEANPDDEMFEPNTSETNTKETSNLSDSSLQHSTIPTLHDSVSLAAAVNATVRVPRNIRVERNDIIYHISLEEYVKNVLPREWPASWNTNSLNAGSVAVRSYAVNYMHGRGPNTDFDICGTSNCQVFVMDGNTTQNAIRAVQYTAGQVMLGGDGTIAGTPYSAENNSLDRGDCGDGFTAPNSGCLYDPICIGQSRSGHGRGMCQRGSRRWGNGDRGFPRRDYVWILHHYYPNRRLVQGTPLVAGDNIRSRSSNCHVRACPGGGIDNGVNCALITTKSSGQTGVIIGEPIRAMADGKGFTWYPIQWNDGNSTVGWSAENYIVRVIPAATAPTGLTATAVATNQIDLSWTDTSDVEDSFQIERAPAASGPWIEIGIVDADVTGFSDRNLPPASTWHYRVRARNPAGATSFTSVAGATTSGAVAPSLAAIPDRMIAQGSLLTFAANATAPDRIQLITDFEPFMSELANGVVLFQTPTNSITTRQFIDSAVDVGTNNLAAVTETYPITGHSTGKVLLVTCQFTNANNAWLRLTTEGTATLPNPVIDFTRKLRFNIRADKEIGVALGCRETATPAGAVIGSNGGTSGAIEWVGVTGVAGGTPVPSRVVAPNSWTTLTFDLPNEPVRSFSGGNGFLSTASALGVLEHLAIVPREGVGVYNVYLDNFAVIGPPKFSYSLGPDAPGGASINPTNGVFKWIPSPGQSPSTNTLAVIVTDDNLPPLSATNTFTVIVRENVPNSPPMLAPIATRTVNAGATVMVACSAFDPNAMDTLTFSLDPGAPPGAAIDPSTGVFTWKPPETDANTTRVITVRATDDGQPPLSGTASFSVIVLPKNDPPILAPIGNRSVHVGMTVGFTALAFDANAGDTLTFSVDPGAPPAAGIHPTSGLFTWTATPAEVNSVNAITLRVTDNAHPPLSGTMTFAVAVHPAPVVDGVSISGGAAVLTWNAAGGVTYRVEYKNTLEDAQWQPLGSPITATGPVASASDAGFNGQPQRFYRILVME